MRKLADEHGLCLVQLAAPTTPPARLDRIVRASRGFLYLVSYTGVTGSDRSVAYRRLAPLVRRACRISRLGCALSSVCARMQQLRDDLLRSGVAWIAHPLAAFNKVEDAGSLVAVGNRAGRHPTGQGRDATVHACADEHAAGCSDQRPGVHSGGWSRHDIKAPMRRGINGGDEALAGAHIRFAAAALACDMRHQHDARIR